MNYMMNNVTVNKTTKANIRSAKKLFAKGLRPEELALLAKREKDISDTDLELLKPLSHCYKWLTMAHEAAAVVLRNSAGLKEDVTQLTGQSLSCYIDMRADQMRSYYGKAVIYYREYRKVLRKLGLVHSGSAVLPVTPVSTESVQTA